jgi:hypothetical protein
MSLFALPLLAAALSTGETAQINDALLAGLPVKQVVLEAHGKKQSCEGPSLASVVARLGVPQGEKLRGPALAQAVVLRAKDGYEVAFSLGEIDPAMGNSPAIIAVRCDGQPLIMGEGPYRLIVPGEKRPARSAKMVTSIRIK